MCCPSTTVKNHVKVSWYFRINCGVGIFDEINHPPYSYKEVTGCLFVILCLEGEIQERKSDSRKGEKTSNKL